MCVWGGRGLERKEGSLILKSGHQSAMQNEDDKREMDQSVRSKGMVVVRK